MKKYNEVNGTSYDPRTPEQAIRVLESARINHRSFDISLGDTESGRDWLDEHDIFGYVGRSTGPAKVPLLIANRCSLGGGAILDHCIVRIRASVGGHVPHQHPTYQHQRIEIRPKDSAVTLRDGRVLTVDTFQDGEQLRRRSNVSVQNSVQNSCQTMSILENMDGVSPFFTRKYVVSIMLGT